MHGLGRGSWRRRAAVMAMNAEARMGNHRPVRYSPTTGIPVRTAPGPYSAVG